MHYDNKVHKYSAKVYYTENFIKKIFKFGTPSRQLHLWIISLLFIANRFISLLMMRAILAKRLQLTHILE